MPERTLYEDVVAWVEAQPSHLEARFPSGASTWRGSLVVARRTDRTVLRSRHATRTRSGRCWTTLTQSQAERLEVKVGARYRPIVDVLREATPCPTCHGERYVNRWDQREGSYEDVPSPCPTCTEASPCA